MHSMIITAVVREVERDRQRNAHLRSLAAADRAQGFDAFQAGRPFARRRLAGISLRPRLS